MILNCPTTWSSIYLMIDHLLKIMVPVGEDVDEMGWDCLQSEWTLMGHLKLPLQPFANHTKLPEGDAIVLSTIVPAVLDLDYNLLKFHHV